MCESGPGTKRPHQFFFCPMQLLGHDPAARRGPLLQYRISRFAYPLHLRLLKAVNPVGGLGLWNQYEYLKLVLQAVPEAGCTWVVKELLWEQSSMSDHHATGVQEVSTAVRAKAKGDTSVSSHAPDPCDIFDAPFLSTAPVPAAALQQKENGNMAKLPGRQQDDDSGSELDDVCEEVDAGIQELFEELLPLDADEDDVPKASAADRSDKGMPRAAQIKTVATDLALVQRALGRRPGC